MGRRPLEPDLATLRGRIGASIRKYRIKRDWTQPELAAHLTKNKLRTSKAAVSYWESGSRMPSVEALYCIARTLRVPISELLPSR
jgi:transcriptional regulator with XRE-family HTH domain